MDTQSKLDFPCVEVVYLDNRKVNIFGHYQKANGILTKQGHLLK